MPSISLTSFVDFVAASGTARITRVRASKKSYGEGYSPQRDYWKPFRDRVSVTFDSGWSTANLRDALADVTDEKKQANYEICRKGLTKWVGRKTITTLPAVKDTWSSGGLNVRVNPELHLEVDGTAHLIKLYLRAEPLSKQKADLVLHLLGKFAERDEVVAVLDVRRSKLITPTVLVDGLDALLEAEAVALTTLWNAIS